MSERLSSMTVAGAINLQGTLLLPGCTIPLRLFEPRYVKMIEHALGENNFHFCVGRVEGAETENLSRCVAKVGTLGRVEFARLMPDGTYELALMGISRVNFVEWLATKPFPMNRFEVLETRHSGAKLVKTLEKFRFFVEGATEYAASPLTKAVLAILGDLSDPSHTVDRLGNLLVQDEKDRAALLEELDGDERLRLLLNAANLPEF